MKIANFNLLRRVNPPARPCPVEGGVGMGLEGDHCLASSSRKSSPPSS